MRIHRSLLVAAAVAACGPKQWPAPATVAPAATASPTATPTAAPAPVASPPQAAPRVPADTGAIAFLLDESRLRSKVPDDFRYLTEVIGPRLTGSAGMRRANDWTMTRLREYGADSVALEPWPFGVSWQRGPLTARLLEPHARRVDAASWAWAPGTNGPVAGDVVFVDPASRADFDQRFAGKLRGAWIMLETPYPRVNPWGATAADSARVDSLRRARRQRAVLPGLGQLLAQQAIAGEIIDGAKDFGLFTMSGSPDFISPYPQLVIGNQVFSEMHRSLGRGERVRFEASISNTIGRDTLIQWNTVGEIRGSELPNEVVLLGAHLDSWDLGTGTTDNAAGSVAVLEAARLLGALKATGVRPRRTIRFVLFSGEEQGLLGSQYYVLRHVREMANYQAVLVLDNGTGRIVGMPLQGMDELRGLWESMLAPLASLGPIPVRTGSKGGTDHLPFIEARVPSFNYDQMSRGYDYTHHSQADVFDAAQPADIAQAATVMAVNAWQLANLDRLLPRRR